MLFLSLAEIAARVKKREKSPFCPPNLSPIFLKNIFLSPKPDIIHPYLLKTWQSTITNYFPANAVGSARPSVEMLSAIKFVILYYYDVALLQYTCE